MSDDKVKNFPRAKRYTPDDLSEEYTVLHDCFGEGTGGSHAFAVKYKNTEEINIVCLGCGTPMPLRSIFEESDE